MGVRRRRAQGEPDAQAAAAAARQAMAVDVALAEFGALRAEIANRLTTQAALVGVGLTALGVLVGLVVRDGGDNRLLLAVPPLAFAVNLLWSIENRQIRVIGRYIRTTLWPYLAGLTDSELPSWEREAARGRHGLGNTFRSAFTDSAMTSIFAVAAIVSLAIVGDFRGDQVGGVSLDSIWLTDLALAISALLIPYVMTGD